MTFSLNFDGDAFDQAMKDVQLKLARAIEKEFTVPFVKEQDGHEIFKVYGTPALDAPLQVVKEAERILTLDQVREMLGSLPPMPRVGVIVENA